MKKIKLLLTCILSAITLSACNLIDNESDQFKITALSTPKNIRVDSDDYVYWDEIPNATSYMIKINNYQEDVGNQSNYSIASIMNDKIDYDVPTQLHIYIKAIGNYIHFSNSEWSREFIHTYTKTKESDEVSNMLGTYINSGVGRSVNVIKAKNYSDYIQSHSVLDIEKLKNDNLFVKKSNTKEIEIKSNSTQSINDFINENAVIFDVNTSTNSNMRTMFSNIDTGLNSSVSFKYSLYWHKYYYSLDSYIQRYALTLSNSIGDYLNMLSENYRNDLNNLYLNQTQNNFYKFFENYGTHLISSGIFGGRLNAYYTTVTNKTTIDSKISEELKTIIDSSISAVNTDQLEQNVVSKITNVLNTSEFKSSFYALAYGGNEFSANTINDMNSHYTDWTNSFNTSDENAVLINYPVKSLIGLWDILPQECSSMRNNMENAFVSYYELNYNKLIQSFEYSDTINYAGGQGSLEKPYLISKPSHLKNIEKNISANYKLISDIDLSSYSDWASIGGFYKEKAFNGTLDGQNHVIRGLKRTTEIAEKNSRIYFGLFGYIEKKAVVKNLIFENVKVKVQGPAVNNSSTRVYFGILAGSFYGTAENIIFRSGSFEYNCCTNGASFVGSIAGNSFNSTITNCTNYVNLISGRYAASVGGFVGQGGSITFKNLSNYGNLKSYCTAWGGASWTGGIIGERFNTYDCTYDNCINSGKLEAVTYDGTHIGCNHRTSNDEGNVLSEKKYE